MQNKLKIELYVIEHNFVMRYNKYAEGVKSEIGDIVFLGLFLSMQVDTGKQINTKNHPLANLIICSIIILLERMSSTFGICFKLS